MNIPSLKGFFVIGPIKIPDVLHDVTKSDMMSGLEVIAKARLEPQQAAVGSYQLTQRREGKSARMTLGQYWILRHQDLSDGRANFTIHLRETEGVTTAVWHMSGDQLVEGHIADFQINRRYTRVGSQGQYDWAATMLTRSEHLSMLGMMPAVRLAPLMEQCKEMAQELSKWLAANHHIVNRDRTEVDVSVASATQSYLAGNLLFYALSEETLAGAKDYLNGNGSRPERLDVNSGYQRLRQDHARAGTLAQEEHLELFTRLERSLKYIREEPATVERPISLSNLLGLQTRWINEIRELLPAFRRK